MSDAGEVVRATFQDGRTEDWTTGPGVSLSAAVLKAFVETCVVPPPVSVEIVDTATPQLPFEQSSA